MSASDVEAAVAEYSFFMGEVGVFQRAQWDQYLGLIMDRMYYLNS